MRHCCIFKVASCINGRNHQHPHLLVSFSIPLLTEHSLVSLSIMQELSRVLNGDNKTEVTPIFHVTMCLERNNRVELQPTIQSLFDMIHHVSRNLIIVIQSVPRLALQVRHVLFLEHPCHWCGAGEQAEITCQEVQKCPYMRTVPVFGHLSALAPPAGLSK